MYIYIYYIFKQGSIATAFPIWALGFNFPLHEERSAATPHVAARDPSNRLPVQIQWFLLYKVTVN